MIADYTRRRLTVSVAALAVVSACLAVASAQVNVTTQHNDASRTGANLAETTLTTSNVNATQFGKLFERAVDDEIYGQPLYVAGVVVPGVGARNVVYVATVNDSVYAFDADDPAAAAPLWAVHYTNPGAGIVPVSHTDVGQSCGTYHDFDGNIGIVGTPVIDPVRQTIYFVARTNENGTFVQRLHAVDITTGTERTAAKLIQASVVGQGDGRDAQNNIAFNARTQNQRAALLMDHGTVYVAWGSHCDQGPYHGWILGYDPLTLQQVFVYNTTPDGGLGGIWQAGGGLAADASGNLVALTGNGAFTGDTGGRDRGNSFIKVSPAGTLLDWFTPYNWAFLNATDEDLGSLNALLIPNTNLVIGGGKEGVMYLVNTSNMGHVGAGNNSQVVQSFQASSAGRMYGASVYWNSPTYGPAIYLWPAGDPLKVFRLVNGLIQVPASAQSSLLSPGGLPGGQLALSANGSAAGSGILWAALSRSGDANPATQPGILRAYDASDVTHELWNSQQNATRDSLASLSKFSPPTVASGKVYVATFSNKLVAYGPIAGSGNAAPFVNAGSDQSITLPSGATLTGIATDDGKPTPPGQLTIGWTLVSGPGPVTLGSANQLTTSAAFTVPGTYTFRLTANDGALTSTDTVIVIVNAASGAGTGLLGQYFNDAGNGTYFTAMALTRTDAVVDFSWAAGAPAAAVHADNFSARWTGQVLAPVTGSYTFATISDDGARLWVNDQLVIDNWADQPVLVTKTSAPISLVGGTRYNIRVDYYDHTGGATARLLWSYPGQAQQVIPQSLLYPAPPVNQPPAVNAGLDQTITLPAVAQLSGAAVDDGLPTPPSAMTTTWAKISGREDSAGGTVVFANPNALTTTATFGADGIYVLRLTASDGAVTVSDDVTITVNAATGGSVGTGLLAQYFNDSGTGTHFSPAPVLSRTDATVNFDWGTAAPAPGIQADNFSVRWSGQVVAPVTGSYTFATISDDGARLWVNDQMVIDNLVDQPALTTKTSAPVALIAGSFYNIRLDYFDHTAGATAKLLWSYPGQAQQVIPQSALYPAPPVNAAPTANAGADQTVTLPATASLAGVATDDGLPSPPGLVTVTWSAFSGPGSVTFANATAANTTATFSASGSYVLRLTVFDGALSATDDVSITVNPAAMTVPVPAVVNLTLAAASASITNSGLVVGTVTNQASATVAAGAVISQSPIANTPVSAGSAVNLVVSTGPALVSVPNVVGQQQAAATAALTAAGLVAGTITSQASATVASGAIISQSPAAGTQVSGGTAVSLVVSTGPSATGPIVDATVFSDGSGTRTTPAFSTTAPGDLLLAFAASDGPSGSAQTLTISGAGLTWTIVRRANTRSGTSEIWRATATAVLTNATVQSSQAASGYRQSLTVVAFRGASGVGASAIANAASGAPTVTLVTTKANSVVYGVGNDWDRAVARTVGANQVMVHQYVDTVTGDTYWVQRRSAAVPASGTSIAINDTAPTNDRWNFASVEVVP